jgi:hypothetical protein
VAKGQALCLLVAAGGCSAVSTPGVAGDWRQLANELQRAPLQQPRDERRKLEHGRL